MWVGCCCEVCGEVGSGIVCGEMYGVCKEVCCVLSVVGYLFWVIVINLVCVLFCWVMVVGLLYWWDFVCWCVDCFCWW